MAITTRTSGTVTVVELAGTLTADGRAAEFAGTIRSRIHAISVERRVKHPAVAAIAEGARADAAWQARQAAGARR